MKYDAVVIGSGLGGLICARELAKSGRGIVVLERQQQPGGCLQSYRRAGLELDTGLHYVGGLDAGQALHEAFDSLGLLSLPWQRLDPDGFDQITIGNQTFPLVQGFDRFADKLSEYFPEERTSLRQFVEMLRQLPPMEKLIRVNAYDYLTSLFRDPLLINVLSASAMRMELRRDSLPLFTLAHGLSSYIQSSWRLKGSGNLIVDSLISDIKAAGGEIYCGTEVTELQEAEGRVVAAHCTGGRTFEGSLFISDAHPQITFDWLKESRKLKGVFRHRIAALENTFGMFTVSLVLKPGKLQYFNHNKYVYRKPNVWTFSEEADAIGGVNTRVGRRGEGYEKLKQRLADDCIKLAERVVPGLSDMVERHYTSTPLTWRDYTLSPRGSAFGVRKDCRNPLMTMLSPKTPIPNLFLTGQSLALHGVEGVTKTAFNTLETIKQTKI